MKNGHAKTSSQNVADRWFQRQAGRPKEARALRIYEYIDNHGIVLWSFTRLPFNVVRRLNVSDVRGTHFRTHISDIQQMSFQMKLLGEEG